MLQAVIIEGYGLVIPTIFAYKTMVALYQSIYIKLFNYYRTTNELTLTNHIASVID
jgi:hypothetical protein